MQRLGVAASSVAQPTSSLSRLFAMFVFGALGLSILLLAVAALPSWVVAMRGPRLAGLLEEWRVHFAAAGLSTLFAAATVFLIGVSS